MRHALEFSQQWSVQIRRSSIIGTNIHVSGRWIYSFDARFEHVPQSQRVSQLDYLSVIA